MGISPEEYTPGKKTERRASWASALAVFYHMIHNLADGWTGRPLDFGVATKVGRRSTVSLFGAADVDKALEALGPLRPVARIAI